MTKRTTRTPTIDDGRSRNRDLVVIGASAGGLPALDTILSSLPSSLPAAVAIVMHTRSDGVLPEVLARRSRLPVGAADASGTRRTARAR